MGGQAQWSPGLRGTYPLACSQRCHRHRVSGTRRGRQRARWVCGREGSHGPGRTWSLTVPLRAGCPLPPGAVRLSRVIPRPAPPLSSFPEGRRVRSMSSGSGARPLALCPLPLVAAARVHGGAGGRSATIAPPGTCPHACSGQGPWRRAVLCEVTGGARGRLRHTLMPTRPPHLVKNDGSAHSLSTEPRRVAVRKQDCPGGDPQAGRESAALSPAP